METIRVLLADDHTIVRKGLRSLLDEEPNINVIAEAEDGREAVEKALELLPDVVVMDISMPLVNGLEATRTILRQNPQIKIIVLTVHTDSEYIFQILNAGSSGYLVKNSAPEELVTAIHAVHQGGSYLSPSISKKVVNRFVEQNKELISEDSYSTLTNREREILQLIAEGYSTREVAESLHISVKTAETHRANMMAKLDLSNMVDLMKYAIRRGIIDLNS